MYHKNFTYNAHINAHTERQLERVNLMLSLLHDFRTDEKWDEATTVCFFQSQGKKMTLRLSSAEAQQLAAAFENILLEKFNSMGRALR